MQFTQGVGPLFLSQTLNDFIHLFSIIRVKSGRDAVPTKLLINFISVASGIVTEAPFLFYIF